MQEIKCVVVGDHGVGKTSLINRFTRDEYPFEYTAVMYGDNKKTIMIDDKSYNLFIYDTAGHEEYARLRPLTYDSTDIFLVCFNVTVLWSFRNIREQWIPEISHYCPNVPYLLVGTQIDLRDTSDEVSEKPITVDLGASLARDIKAVQYMECSSKTQEGLKEIFDAAVLAAVQHKAKREKKRKCICL